jgi:hypothetical protein
MSYELFFADVFFTALHCALRAMPEEDWQAMIDDPDVPLSEFSDADDAFLLAVEVNSCTDLQDPVEVWIDEEGYHTVKVYGLAHYLKHFPEACVDDCQAIWEIYEDSRPCNCPDCKE